MNYPVYRPRLKKELIEVFGEEAYTRMAETCSIESMVTHACVKCFVYRLNKEEIRKHAYNQGY